MKIKNQTKNPVTGNLNFLDYYEEITSDVYGIYNTANPGDYPSAATPYPYPVVLKRTDTLVRGQIVSENGSQPLHGTQTVFIGGKDNAQITDDAVIETYIYAVNKANKKLSFFL